MKKCTLITCASSEIGRRLSDHLSDHKLILTARRKETINSENQTVSLDFFDELSIASAVEQISESDFERIDNIVFIIPRIPTTSEIFPQVENWRELWDNYFIKPLSFLKKIYERNLIANGGKIVLISGLSSKTALSHYAVNNCIRSAWLGQAKTLALALGEQKISVNTLSLGGVLTNSYKEKLQQRANTNNCTFEEQHRQEAMNIPLGSYASVEDVVYAIDSLIGPLSNHLTGQNILLDGGFFRGY